MDKHPAEEWPWSGVLKCRRCGKRYTVPNPEGEDPNFCPFCGSIDVKVDIEESKQ